MKKIKHPRVYDRNNELVAVLQNAFAIGYDKQKNNLWTCDFTIPMGDAKAVHIKPKNFIELFDHERRIGLFVVNPKQTVKNESTNEITYHCEHVLSLLHSDVLFGYHQFSNYRTRFVLEELFKFQETPHWELGAVEFERWFHYGWENEDSLLNAIMSIPQPFDEPHLWTWDDTTYPFTLNLVQPNDAVKGMIITGKNLKGIEIEEDPTSLVTRIYPLGFGEGVNQLNISEVNGGQVYLEDAAAIAEYGLHKRIWIDRRFENADSLKASAQAILDKFKQPIKTMKIDAVDYELIDPYELSRYEVGDVLRVHDRDTETDEEIRIEKMRKGDLYGNPFDLQMELGNVIEDISTTFADLESKQLVNETYSQGATNIDSRDFADNCDPNFPAMIRFPIPNDVVNINEMLLTFETQPYRAYSKAVEGGGASVSSTSSGGSSTQTSSSGGGTSTTSGSGGGVSTSTGGGGGTTRTSSAENYRQGTSGHNHGFPDLTVFLDKEGRNQVWRESGQHEHTFTIPTHTHDINIPNHTHSLTVDAHTHSISIPSHTHSITLPNHEHDIKHGIFERSQMPSAVTVRVDGVTLPGNETSSTDIDLLPYLAKDDAGRIQRGRYAEIEIIPNDLARINATVTSRLFIQSRIGEVM